MAKRARLSSSQSLRAGYSEAYHGKQGSDGIQTIPAAASSIARALIALTPGDNVTTEVIRKLLNDERVDLPPYERANNITWDQDEILWQDGVQPGLDEETGIASRLAANTVHFGGADYRLSWSASFAERRQTT
jgi:hypothetical protein